MSINKTSKKGQWSKWDVENRQKTTKNVSGQPEYQKNMQMSEKVSAQNMSNTCPLWHEISDHHWVISRCWAWWLDIVFASAYFTHLANQMSKNGFGSVRCRFGVSLVFVEGRLEICLGSVWDQSASLRDHFRITLVAYGSLWDNFGIRLGPIPCNLELTTWKSASFRSCVRAKLRVALSPMRFSPVVLVSLRSTAPVAGGVSRVCPRLSRVCPLQGDFETIG